MPEKLQEKYLVAFRRRDLYRPRLIYDPGKIFVKFSSPAGKTIVSNGKACGFILGSNICGIQDLAGGGSGGIAALTSGYFAIVTAQGPGGYTIKLKNNDKSFQEITLMVDSTFFLRKAIIKTKDGGTYNFSLSNISFSAPIIPCNLILMFFQCTGCKKSTKLKKDGIELVRY